MKKKKDPVKAYILRKKIFAVLFLIALFGYSGVNAWYSLDTWVWEWKEEVDAFLAQDIVLEELPDRLSYFVSEIDESIVISMYGRMEFIEGYSYIQVLLDKREIDNFTYIKDEDGYLHLASFFREDSDSMERYAKRMKRLKEYAEPRGTKVLFFVTPGKYVRGETNFRTGMPVDDPNNLVDELLFFLNRYGVRQSMEGSLFPMRI